ncbi:AraC family transcriptional regulator [Nocardioides sp.]|uniref:AraC family transcriptional regulator n=1 Tax=Nocardioides sp. TaxID=35761 RepID=UPI003514F731
MVTTIRAASLDGFVDLAREVGGDPRALLRRHGIEPGDLRDPETLLSHTAHDAMLDEAAEEWSCPDLGLRLAERQDLSILGPLAVAVEACGSGTDAVAIAARYLFAHAPALTVAVDDDPLGRRGVVALTYAKDPRLSPYSAQGIEHGLGVFFRVARTLVGLGPSLRSVHVPHRPLSPLRRYTDYFGADVRFGAPTAALCVQRHLLEQSLAAGDPQVRERAVRHLAERYGSGATGVRDRVRVAVAAALAAGAPTLEGVARLLALHPRTLQRRLAGEGTTYAQVLDDVRREVVVRHLRDSRLPVGQVAALAGFSEQAALNHAVQRWFGTTPRRLRSSADPVTSFRGEALRTRVRSASD